MGEGSAALTISVLLKLSVKPGERKQRRSPTALSPHCQETELGLDRGGRGGGAKEEKREKETKTQQVCSGSM